MKKGKDADGKTTYLKTECSGTHRTFMQLLYRRLEKFLWHNFRHWYCFRAKRSSQQLDERLAEASKDIIRELDTASPVRRRELFALLRGLLTTAIFERDYAENHTCHSYEEPQSAYWCYKQVTLMPYVIFYLGGSGVSSIMRYNSPDAFFDAVRADPSVLNASKFQLRKEYKVMVSDYHSHDNNFSQHSEHMVLRHLQEHADRPSNAATAANTVPFSYIQVWSDNAVHFKCADEFYHTANFGTLAGQTSVHKLQAHTAEHHGASEVDSVAWQCKSVMRNEEDRPGGKPPQNGKEAVEFLCEKLSQHAGRESSRSRNSIHRFDFLYLGEAGCTTTVSAQTLDDAVTHKLSCFRTGNGHNMVHLSTLPCGCKFCLARLWPQCEYLDLHSYVNKTQFGDKLGETASAAWISKPVTPSSRPTLSATRANADVAFAIEHAQDKTVLVVAVDEEDPEQHGFEWAAVRCSGPVEHLKKDRDQCGGTIKKGTLAFPGIYLDRLRLPNGSYDPTRFVMWRDANGSSPILWFRADNARLSLGRWQPAVVGGHAGRSTYVLSDEQTADLGEKHLSIQPARAPARAAAPAAAAPPARAQARARARAPAADAQRKGKRPAHAPASPSGRSRIARR